MNNPIASILERQPALVIDGAFAIELVIPYKPY